MDLTNNEPHPSLHIRDVFSHPLDRFIKNYNLKIKPLHQVAIRKTTTALPVGWMNCIKFFSTLNILSYGLLGRVLLFHIVAWTPRFLFFGIHFTVWGTFEEPQYGYSLKILTISVGES